VAALCLDVGHVAAYVGHLRLQRSSVCGQAHHHAVLHAELRLHLKQLPLQQLHLRLEGAVVVLQGRQLQEGSSSRTAAKAAGMMSAIKD
jgi:hypothetical protein